MAAGKSKFGPKGELLVAVGMLLAAVGVWYITLYQPVQAKAAKLGDEIRSQQDSVVAAERYKAQELALRMQVEKIQAELDTWDSKFPPRDSIVAVAKTLISFAEENNLDLVGLEPSLFELYALERAGAPVAGKFVMQLPLKFRLEGRYLDLGRMLEEVENLPFHLTIADVAVAMLPDRTPDVEIGLDVYLYIHL
jgi:Tfp pilus assembly protein PilO